MCSFPSRHPSACTSSICLRGGRPATWIVHGGFNGVEVEETPLGHHELFHSPVIKLNEHALYSSSACRAGDMLRDFDGAYLQVRLAVSPLAPLLLFLVRWTDCSLAGALGLLSVCIYKVGG